jgi:hypothetical protein
VLLDISNNLILNVVGGRMSFQLVPGWRKNLASVTKGAGIGMVGNFILDICIHRFDGLSWVFLIVGSALFLIGMIGGSQLTAVKVEKEEGQ